MLRLLFALALMIGCGFHVVLERWQQRSCRQQIFGAETCLRDQLHERAAARLRYQHAIIDCCFKPAVSGPQLLDPVSTRNPDLGGGE